MQPARTNRGSAWRTARATLAVAVLAAAAHAQSARSPAGVPSTVPSTVPATAPARTPLDLIPAESLLSWYGRPMPDTEPPDSQPSTIETLLDLGTRLSGRPLPGSAQLGLRAVEALGLAVRYPHALALIDATARPLESDPNSARLDQLRFALIVDCGGRPEAFVRLIQKTVNEQTDKNAATLEKRQAGEWSYQVLRDKRLPAWAAIAWGQIEGQFVLTVGGDVWPHIAAVARGERPSVAGEPWYRQARRGATPTTTRPVEPLIEIFAATRTIRERLDPVVSGRAGAFFRAWEADQVEQMAWSLGLAGRSLFCRAHFRVGENTELRIYADPSLEEPRFMDLVPEESRYAVYRLPVERFLRRFFRSLLMVQGADERAAIERTWAQLQSEHGLDVDRDLLAHLGQTILLHNDPPHPLRLPGAMTGLIEVRDEPAAVRATIDTLCGVLRDALQRTATTKPDGAAAERAASTWNLKHADDGVWYVQIGIVAGPAWTVTERFIVFSWSPQALRMYLDRMGSRLRPVNE